VRKWGVLITTFYAAIVLGVLVPAGLLAGGVYQWNGLLQGLKEFYGFWLWWCPIVALVGGEALLLFVSVDATEKKLKPRSHIFVSGALAAILTALLTASLIGSIGVAIKGDKFEIPHFKDEAGILALWGLLWLAWGVFFYFYLRNSPAVVSRVVSWLIRGSVLEVLINIPCHIMVRRRNECTAPAVTSFGFVTGIAVMLLAFGPSVLFLYKKRLGEYSGRGPR